MIRLLMIEMTPSVWIGGKESAKYRLGVLTELKSRGVLNILICSIDGLKGFEQAISTVFPQTEIKQCIVRQVRKVVMTHSLT